MEDDIIQEHIKELESMNKKLTIVKVIENVLLIATIILLVTSIYTDINLTHKVTEQEPCITINGDFYCKVGK